MHRGGALGAVLGLFISLSGHASGISWGTEETLASGSDVYLAFNNAVVASRDAQGRLFAVWADGGQPKFGRQEDGTWSISDLPRFSPRASADKPTLALLADQHVIVWAETGAGGTHIVATRSTDGGTSWTPPLELASGHLESSVTLHAASRSDGSASVVVAWYDIAANTVYSRTWRGTAWEAAGWTSGRALTSAGGMGHDVALGGRGDQTFAVWEDSRSGVKEIWMIRSNDGGLDWETDYRMTRSDAGSVRGEDPSISVAADGTIYLGYQSAGRIYLATSLDGGTQFAAPLQLGSGLFAHVAVNAYGGLAVSWESFSGSAFDDSKKHYGLALSIDGLATLDSPHALPGSEATTHVVQGVVVFGDDWVDCVWIDVSDASGKRVLKPRAGRIDVAQFGASVEGERNSQSVTANWKIAPADYGGTGDRYLAATLGGAWWMHDGTTWRAWSGGDLPALTSGSLADASFPAASRADLRSLAGLELYAGYRRDGGPLVYRLIHTLH